ncbi:MAG: substrate-binding domain-containing protein [Kiritimatiellae bacterium]|nr:substrate-binding domain-containing protein [Kiritimatiellia bacterium]
MPQSKDILDIVLLLRLSYASGRDILHGVSSFARRERCRWRFDIVNFDAADAHAELRRVMEEGADGAMAIGLYDEAIADEFVSYPVPLVVLAHGNARLAGSRAAPTAFVRTDENAVGRMGAAYLESLGRFRTFGYLKAGRRADGFMSHFAGRDVDLRVFESDVSATLDLARLQDWLRDIPKPAAVMADTDKQASFVIEAAGRAGVCIPKDVALLGVDNDDLVCEMSEPPLASIAVDYQRFGAVAASALRKLLGPARRRGAKWPFTVLVPPQRVVERQSARPVAPASALAERAEAFIRRNATAGISAADVAAHLGVSRSLADLRFRQVMGESMLSMILRLRLDEAARRLRESDLAVGKVIAASGFGDPDHARRLFRRRFGCSMREYRRSRQQAPGGASPRKPR